MAQSKTSLVVLNLNCRRYLYLINNHHTRAIITHGLYFLNPILINNLLCKLFSMKILLLYLWLVLNNGLQYLYSTKPLVFISTTVGMLSLETRMEDWHHTVHFYPSLTKEALL